MNFDMVNIKSQLGYEKMSDTDYSKLMKDFPFLSIIQYGLNEYIGIIDNQDQWITKMYVYNNLTTQKEKSLFLRLGEIWWWESNRKLPISIFLKNDIKPISSSMVIMNTKEVKIIFGPVTSLSNLSSRKSKKKSHQLVNRFSL